MRDLKEILSRPAMAMPWKCPGTAKALLWYRHGTAMALPVTAMAVAWEYDSTAMIVPQHC